MWGVGRAQKFSKGISSASERDDWFLGWRLRASALCEGASVSHAGLSLEGRAEATAGLGSSWSAMWHCCYC